MAVIGKVYIGLNSLIITGIIIPLIPHTIPKNIFILFIYLFLFLLINYLLNKINLIYKIKKIYPKLILENKY